MQVHWIIVLLAVIGFAAVWMLAIISIFKLIDLLKKHASKMSNPLKRVFLRPKKEQ